MAMQKLNDDCIMLIIEELYNDKNSLFSCLLVNRLWCKIVVPILWRDPWEFLKVMDDEKIFDRANKFFNIILYYLPEESRNYLKNQDIDISQQKSPLFNYFHFIKHIKHIVMIGFYALNIYEIYLKSYNNIQKNKLERELYKVFISRCPSIDLLDINGVKQPLYTFSGAKASLSRLCELRCNSDNNSSLFYGLAEICRSIERFCIHYRSSNLGLAKLIEMQQKIRYFRIMHDLDMSDGEVEKEIMKKASQFLYLDIESPLYDKKYLTFLNGLLSKSINLQELKLSVRAGFAKCAMYISFNHYHDQSESLQMIWKVLTQYYLQVNIPGQFNETMFQYYPKVKYIELYAYKERFEQILIYLQNLEGLIISYCRYEIAFRKLLNILIRSASINVYKIQILTVTAENNFDEECLEEFFNNWKGRKPMCLHLYNSKNNKLLERLIDKYVKEGVIKKYVNTKESIIDEYDQISEGRLYERGG